MGPPPARRWRRAGDVPVHDLRRDACDAAVAEPNAARHLRAAADFLRCPGRERDSSCAAHWRTHLQSNRHVMIELRTGDRRAAFDVPFNVYDAASPYVSPMWSDLD